MCSVVFEKQSWQWPLLQGSPCMKMSYWEKCSTRNIDRRVDFLLKTFEMFFWNLFHLAPPHCIYYQHWTFKEWQLVCSFQFSACVCKFLYSPKLICQTNKTKEFFCTKPTDNIVYENSLNFKVMSFTVWDNCVINRCI